MNNFPVLLQLDPTINAANILFDNGVLGVVVFALFCVLAYIYKDNKTIVKEHKIEMMELIKAYQKQNEDMIRITGEFNNTLQTLAKNFQVEEVIQETVKLAIQNELRNSEE